MNPQKEEVNTLSSYSELIKNFEKIRNYMDEIVANIEPTAEIVAHIKPIYNFKAAE